ncbi:MAG: hypothetical protein WCJ03_12475 [Bacteroidales bacterium]
MNTERIDQLLENYFEGQTTVQEEKELQRFFRQNNLPEKYRAEKAMFDYYAAEKARKVKKVPFYRTLWVQTVAAAAVIILAFGLFLQMPQGQALISGRSYMIKNGKVINDPDLVRKEAIKALDDVTGNSKSKVKTKADDEAQAIMLQQLSQFGK